MATLINGNLNDPVYAAQDADLIAAICGNQTCITPVGGKFEATLEDANTIMVEDGVIITQEGRRIQLDAGDIDEFIIPTGSQGITQYYIVGYRLYTDSESAELCENFVEPVDSASETINEGTFRGGETEVYVSLLRVKQEGVNITDIEVLLPYSTDITQINNDLKAVETIANANDIGSNVNIVGYTSANPFVCPSDGYVRYGIINSSTSTGSFQVGIIGADGENQLGVGMKTVNGSNAQSFHMVFVKKGMKVFLDANTLSTDIRVYYSPVN